MSFLGAALLVLAAAFLAALVRVVKGPTIADRAAGTDVCLFCVVAAMAILSVELEEPLFLAGVLVATLLGFIATVALARLVDGRRP
jgi:multicomponent Na+:H+ antiporter subunit F